jgi:hypothetical protein
MEFVFFFGTSATGIEILIYYEKFIVQSDASWH